MLHRFINFFYLNKKSNLFEFRDYNKTSKIKIAITYSTDINYIYPTLVSMTSLIINGGNNTIYYIFILHTPTFSEKNKHIFNTLENKYKDRCRIIYINMGKMYKNLKFKKTLSLSAYYRLSLQDILPNINKIIYLDGDTLVLGDLKELIDLDMKGNVVMGFIDDEPSSIESFGLINSTVICSGVLLLDLRGLRENNYSKKIEDFISKNRNRLIQEDQTIVNVVMQDRLGPIPPKYGIWPLTNKEKLERYLNIKRSGKKYSKKSLLNAIKHPVIIHFVGRKPFWSRKSDNVFDKIWWNFARASGYYDEIYKSIKN